mmetsp:Transcript_22122/g.32908  ORF Transcript_22122/g.32908 Transcript_22122/m.32908 type:complete len:216 (+) Transcript_22122:93-740(+)
MAWTKNQTSTTTVSLASVMDEQLAEKLQQQDCYSIESTQIEQALAASLAQQTDNVACSSNLHTTSTTDDEAFARALQQHFDKEEITQVLDDHTSKVTTLDPRQMQLLKQMQNSEPLLLLDDDDQCSDESSDDDDPQNDNFRETLKAIEKCQQSDEFMTKHNLSIAQSMHADLLEQKHVGIGDLSGLKFSNPVYNGLNRHFRENGKRQYQKQLAKR